MRGTGKPDANAEALVELWRSKTIGGAAWYMAPGIGYDLTVALAGVFLPVEVKDGSLPPSKRQLTPNEQAQREKLTARGVPYTVWECEQDVLDLAQRLRGA